MNTQTNPTMYIGKTGNSVSDAGMTIDFNANNDGVPALFAAMQSFNGPDTATLRMSDLTDSTVTIKVEEEQSANQEQSHATENVGYMALFTSDSVLPPPPVATQGTVESINH